MFTKNEISNAILIVFDIQISEELYKGNYM